MSKFTIMLPVSRQNLVLANNCIRHLLQNSPYNIIVLDEYGNDAEYIQDSRVKYIHFTGERPSLVKLWNRCIENCPTDYVIITSWRQRPNLWHFQTIEEKLDQGFGMVAFDGMHMFAFHKYLTQKVGWFDEGFTTGQLEDTDWWYRLKQNNVGIYVGDVAEERHVNGQYIDSCWLNGSPNKAYFDTKWKEDPNEGTLTLFHEEKNIQDRSKYSYEPIEYKTWNESELTEGLTKHFQIFHTVVNKCL